MTGGDLYVCRVLADGTIAMAKPCDNCMQLIREKGIDTVHYSGSDNQWHSIELRYER